MRKGLAILMLGCCFGLAVAGCNQPSAEPESEPAAAPEEAAAPKVNFASDIQPILEARCWKCHGGDKIKGELRLNLKDTAMKGGASGPVILPGDSENSLLIKLIQGPHDDIDRMPPKDGYLSDEEIALLVTWVDEGAAWSE